MNITNKPKENSGIQNTYSIDDDILKKVPVKKKKEAKNIIDSMKKNNQRIFWNEKGELVDRGNVIPGSDIKKLFKSVLTKEKNSKKKSIV